MCVCARTCKHTACKCMYLVDNTTEKPIRKRKFADQGYSISKFLPYCKKSKMRAKKALNMVKVYITKKPGMPLSIEKS